MNPSSSGSHHSQQRPSSRPQSRNNNNNPHTSSSSSSSNHHEEDRLARAWRAVASSVVLATQRAEKAAPQPTKESLRDLDDAVVGFLRFRKEFGRQIAHVEAKIQGKAQEMETMDCYMRSQPRLGRKRKRTEAAAVETTTAVEGGTEAATVNSGRNTLADAI